MAFRRFSGAHSSIYNVQHVRRWFDHTDAERTDYVDEILDRKFVLCPRGLSPLSHRLYEVMALGRGPVIISDDWVPPTGIEWNRSALFIKEAEMPRIIEILSAREHQWCDYGQESHTAWVRHVYMPNSLIYAIDEIADIIRNRPPGYDECQRQNETRGKPTV